MTGRLTLSLSMGDLHLPLVTFFLSKQFGPNDSECVRSHHEYSCSNYRTYYPKNLPKVCFPASFRPGWQMFRHRPRFYSTDLPNPIRIKLVDDQNYICHGHQAVLHSVPL